MSDGDKAQRRESRADRLRAALRENLKRRKAQARGRGAAAGAKADRPGKGGDTGDETPES